MSYTTFIQELKTQFIMQITLIITSDLTAKRMILVDYFDTSKL